MAIGLIGSVGKPEQVVPYVDYDITVVAQTGGQDNWKAYAAGGTNCYVYDLPVADIPNADISLDTDFAILPRGTITATLLENFSNINAAEVTTIDNATVLRLYSMSGKPSVDITITLRKYNQ